MKKTAIALAAMIAASSSALAADFTVYGKVDFGFAYNNWDLKSTGADETFTLDAGNNSGSRFGFKGTEDLGNGYAVSFQLENGFDADTGSLGQDGRLFGREARLSLETPYGTASFGRMGALTSGMGTYDLFQLYGDTIDGGWNYAIDTHNWADRGRYDNMVTLASPKFAGLQGFAQYSFGTDAKKELDDSVVNERETQRYAALGVTYDNGPLSAGLFYDSVLREHAVASPNVDDAQTVSLALAYDFEVVKVTLGAQYGKDEDMNFFQHGEVAGFATADGYRLHLGAAFPTEAGTFRVATYYGDVENDETDKDATNINVALTHEYPLSKRTYIYSGLGYKYVKAEDQKTGKVIEKETDFTALLGLVHSF